LISLIGVNFSKIEDKIFPLIEGRVIIPIIFIFTIIIAWKQTSNTLDFRSIFPDLKYKKMGLLDLFSNIICAVVVIFFNFFLLAFNSSLIDIVLNSIASLFIIELDDIAVFITSDAITDLYKQKLIQELLINFKNIPAIYFDTNIWKLNYNRFTLNDRYYCSLTEYNIDKPIRYRNNYDAAESIV
jgi:hypothetical protein